MENRKATPKLNRAVGLGTAILLVAGVMIGSGVYKKIIPLAQTGLSESWILTAWVLAGIITIFGALNVSALASMTEESGGVYEYLRLSFGNFFSFLFGWTDFTVIGTASAAALAYIFAQAVNTLIPLPDPLAMWAHLNIEGVVYPFADSGIKILAMAAIFTLCAINYRGVKESGLLNNVFTIAKICGILFIIIAGLFIFSPEIGNEIVADAPKSVLESSNFFSVFFIAMLSVLWAYDGWQDITFLSGEIKNPKRNVGRAAIGGIAIAMFLYVLINVVYMHVMSLNELAAVGDQEIGAAAVADKMLGNAGELFILILIVVSVFGSLNAVILSHSRVYFRMAQEEFFFKKVARVHKRFHTPHVSLLLTASWSAILVVTGSFDLLSNLAVLANYLFYGVLAVAVLKMNANRTIQVKVIGYPYIQIILILFTIVLIGNTIYTSPGQASVGVILMLSGAPLYFYFRKMRKRGIVKL